MVDRGAFNLAPKTKVQPGMIHVTDEIEALPLGLLDIAISGFLPVFLFFNSPKR